MTRTIDSYICTQVQPSEWLRARANRSMHPWPGTAYKDKPGYWVLLTKRTYAYREHTGDITFWRQDAR